MIFSSAGSTFYLFATRACKPSQCVASRFVSFSASLPCSHSSLRAHSSIVSVLPAIAAVCAGKNCSFGCSSLRGRKCGHDWPRKTGMALAPTPLECKKGGGATAEGENEIDTNLQTQQTCAHSIFTDHSLPGIRVHLILDIQNLFKYQFHRRSKRMFHENENKKQQDGRDGERARTQVPCLSRGLRREERAGRRPTGQRKLDQRDTAITGGASRRCLAWLWSSSACVFLSLWVLA